MSHIQSQAGGQLDRMRRRFVAITSAVGLLIASAFVFVNAARGDIPLVAADLVLITLLGVNLFLIPRAQSLLVPTLVAVGAVMAFLGLTMRLGYVQAYMWVYVVPAAVFFMVGLRRGLPIVLLLAGMVAVGVTLWPPRVVAQWVEVSILVSFGFVVAQALLYEWTRHRYEVELRELSITDPLTGIANRRRLHEALSAEIIRAERYRRPLSVIVFDVDHFKSINDRHGHSAGDDVLRVLTARVTRLLRSTDVFARLGGDEFIVLLPETSASRSLGRNGVAEAESSETTDIGSALAERLRRAVSEHAFDRVGKVSITLGVAEYESGDDVAAILERADRALYRAKERGRDRVAVA